MNDDELLEGTIAQFRAERKERERRAHHERLDAYVERRLDADSVRTLAPDDVDDLDDEIEAFAPLSAEARAVISQRLVTLVQAKNANNAATDASETSQTGETEKPARPVVVTLRRLTVAVSALAIAASLAFVLRGRTVSDVPLPKYELAFVGGEQAWRGEAPGTSGAIGPVKHRFSHGEHVRLSLRPSTTAIGNVEGRIFLRRGDDVRPWPTAVDVSNAGALRVAASPDTLPAGTEGEWELVVAVGRPGDLPSASELRSPKASVQIVSTLVTLAP